MKAAKSTLTVSYSYADRRWNVVDEEGVNRGFGKDAENAIFSAKTWAKFLATDGIKVTIMVKPMKGRAFKT